MGRHALLQSFSISSKYSSCGSENVKLCLLRCGARRKTPPLTSFVASGNCPVLRFFFTNYGSSEATHKDDIIF